GLLPDAPDVGESAHDPGHSLAERAVEQLAEAASRSEGLLVLVLDDVHVLSDPEVIGSLDAVLRHPPTNLRVVMTALNDPVLPLHRYRIQGYLAEIRAAELAMTTDEIEQLLTTHDIHLSPTEIGILAERTEGWVAGVRLSAMRMEGSPEPGRFVTDFAMDRGSIGEYLMEEVLANQPRQVQEVLIRSSICDPISGPLADAICEGEGAAAILNQLANNNCLVTALDHEGGRFRYHPLLREVLRYLLNGRPAAVRRRSQVNAARWHASEGNLVEALQHSVAAQDWAFCADLLTGGAFEQLYLRAVARPMGGIGRFVDAVIDPDLETGSADAIRAAQAAVAAAIGQYDRARALLDGFDPAGLDAGAAALQGVARLLVARESGDAEGVDEAATGLTQYDPQGAFGTFALYERGAVCLWQGADSLAETLLQQALKQATAESLHAIALRCVGRLAIGHGMAGRISLAEQLLGQGAALLQAHPWIPEEFRVAYHLGGAEIALIHGDLDLYSRFLRLVDVALAPKTDPALAAMLALIQAKALQSAGRYAEARDLLVANTGNGLPETWVPPIRARILLLELQGQLGRPLPTVERLAALARLQESTASRALLGAARARFAAGDVEGAAQEVRRIITAQPAPTVLVLIDTMLLSSEIADAQGHETAAVEAATTAVQLAAADRIVLPFIPAGPRVHALLRRHPALQNLWPAPLDDAPGQWARELPKEREDTHLAEPLTEREVSILNWLTTTMTMAEIGTELYVSTNTVKTHVAAIYRKLEVTSRREAIARGRALHLI
ncbi:MAG TPA: LuxR C-terminal-related transcriptional regulator, partial [Lapillicoccus sp.]|nr:LuxR C-terminal-related transcriptional regulator [Lapillicoccus sp.]